jgi:SH3 domain-containing protein
MNFARIATCTAAAMVLSAQSAAAPALAINDVNMRQGPGTTYPIITTIPGGSNVEVTGCQGQWCSVAWHGRSGYAIATSLDQGGDAPPPRGAARPPGSESPPPPPSAADAPIAAYPPGAQPPPPGYGPPPGYYGPPVYYYPYPHAYDYGYGPYYGPYWRRPWW